MIITLAILVLAIVTVGCGAPAAPRSPSEPAAESAEASASPSVQASVQPGSSAAPSGASPSETLEIGDWVATSADGVNLRQGAGIGAESFGKLQAGSGGVIASGPVEADGYSWYAVAASGIPLDGCGPSDSPPLACQGWFGWLAGGDLDGRPWLVSSTPPCPDAPTTAAEFLQHPRTLLYACFGDQTLTIQAHVGQLPSTLECLLPYTVEPAWLHVCSRAILQVSATTSVDEATFDVHVHPSLGGCGFGGRGGEGACPFDPLQGHDIEVQGHFDDPAAESCVASGAPQAIALDPVGVVHTCRIAFVITAVTSIAGP